MDKFPMRLYKGEALDIRNFPSPRRILIVGESVLFRDQVDLDNFVKHAIPIDTTIQYFAPVRPVREETQS